MASSMNTILIIGATSGLGDAFARRFHALGKKVTITGRRQDRLAALQKELPGLETRQLDVTDFATLPSKVSELTKSFPNVNTVFINAGIMSSFSFADPPADSDTAIIDEINTNVTGPMLLTRLLLPHLVALRKPAALFFTSSRLGYVPLGFYPVYCPTKAAIHSFCVALRQQLNAIPDNQVSIVEIVPPHVDTALDAAFRDHVTEALGDHRMAPMALDEYMDKTMAILEGAEAKDLKEVAVGFADMAVSTWRAGFGKELERTGA